MIFISYGQIDPTAKYDSTPTSTNKQPFVNMSDLKIDNLVTPDIQTCEHNYSVLDGTQTHLPRNYQDYYFGWWSKSISDNQGIFTDKPVLDVTFGYMHKAPGLTFWFHPWSDDFVNLVRVTWYATNLTTVLYSDIFILTPIRAGSRLKAELRHSVADFRRITIEFISTNNRNRFLKLDGLDYGVGGIFYDENIGNVNLIEEIDPISDIISINTANFRITTATPIFSPISGNFADDMLMKKQIMQINYNNQNFGTFFLQSWRDVHNNGTTFDFNVIDIIGVLDTFNFWGNIYENVTLDSLIKQIFAIAFPTELVTYEIEEVFANVRLSGWIPSGTCRQALQQICFAIGAIADCSRRDYLWIYAADTELARHVQLDRIYRTSSNIQTQYFSGLDITSYQYTRGTETTEALNATLAIGQHTIRFSEPLHTLTITGGSIIEKTANHAIINVTTAGTVILSGSKYIINNPIHSIRTEIAAGEVESIVEFDNCYLVTPQNVEPLANYLFKYLQNRIQMDIDTQIGLGNYSWNEWNNLNQTWNAIDERKRTADNYFVRFDYNECGYLTQIETGQRPVIGITEQLNISLRSGKTRMRVIGNVETTNNN